MRVIGYTYEADYHCPDCAKARHAAGGFECKPASVADDVNKLDEWDIPYCAHDGEGNLIHPIFSTDELPCHIPAEAGGYSPVACGDCGAVIAEAEG
jgi:hypothetical protein